MDIERAARFIAKFEGFVDHVYLDPVGVETVGYGETDPELVERYRSTGITEPEAFELLKHRVGGYAAGVEDLVAVPLNEDQAIALTSFAYNLGLGALEGSTLRRKLNEGDYGAVPTELLKWVFAGEQVLEGLVRRRQAEADLFSGQEELVLCQRGNTGPAVERVQRLLVERYGFGIAIDGDFGAATEEAVRQFQEAHGLTVDGIVGPFTWRALNEGAAAGETTTAAEPAPADDDGLGWISTQNFYLGVEGFQEAFADYDIAVDGDFGPETATAVRIVRDRGGFLSANFHLEEFRCTHCGRARANRELVRALQRVRDRVGPLAKHSSYRCPDHHLSQGLPNSQHVAGCAWDPDPNLARQEVDGCGFSGIGISSVGLVSHFDVRHASRIGNPTGSTPDNPAVFPD